VLLGESIFNRSGGALLDFNGENRMGSAGLVVHIGGGYSAHSIALVDEPQQLFRVAHDLTREGIILTMR